MEDKQAQSGAARGEHFRGAVQQAERLHSGIDLIDPMIVAEYWEQYERESLYQGWEKFCREVDPYVTHVTEPRDVDIDLVDSMFFEWFVFDCRVSEVGTPLALYAECAPDDLSERQRDLLHQLQQTQRFAQFWVLSQDPCTGISILRDASSGERLRLQDDVVAQTPWWQNGLLGLRVAQLDGTWYMMGRTPMHDAGCSLPLPAPIDRPSFLCLVQKTVGLDGEYTDSVRLRSYRPVDAA